MTVNTCGFSNCFMSFLLCSLVLMSTGSQFSLTLLLTTSLKKWSTLGSGQEETMWYVIMPYQIYCKDLTSENYYKRLYFFPLKATLRISSTSLSRAVYLYKEFDIRSSICHFLFYFYTTFLYFYTTFL